MSDKKAKSLNDLKSFEEVKTSKDLLPRGYKQIWLNSFESDWVYCPKLSEEFRAKCIENPVYEWVAEAEVPTKEEWFSWARYPLYEESLYIDKLKSYNYYDDEGIARKVQARRAKRIDDCYWDYDLFVDEWNKYKEVIALWKLRSQTLLDKYKMNMKEYNDLEYNERPEDIRQLSLDASLAFRSYSFMQQCNRDPSFRSRPFRQFC